MFPPRRLITTADDLGASPGVNEAVIRAGREGVLRFASLMVAEPWAEEAVGRVRRECPGLGLGLHVSLCAGRSVLGAARLGSFVDAEGRFADDPIACGLRYFFDRGLERPLELELRAQFERFLEWGLKPGHVDGHVNIHAHPVVYPILMRLVREYGFRRVRLPGGEFPAALDYAGPLRLPLADGFVLGWMRRYLLRMWGDPRVEVADRVYGLLRSGLMKEGYVLSCLRSLPAGTTEMYFHPHADPATAAGETAVPTHRTYSDLQALLSSEVKAALDSEGIVLVEAE